MTVVHSAPKFASNEGVADALGKALGTMLVSAKEEYGEVVLAVARGEIENALRLLIDLHAGGGRCRPPCRSRISKAKVCDSDSGI